MEKFDCEIKNYKTAFECFKKRFLDDKKSIFRLDLDEEIYTEDSVNYLIENFIENGDDDSKKSFIEKIKNQLIDNPKEKAKDEKIKRNAIEVLAHCVYLWRLPPANANRIDSVKEILDLDEELKKIDLKNNPFFKKFNGFALVGTYYNTNKPFELAYIIIFLEKYLKLEETSKDKVIEILIKKLKNEVTITTPNGKKTTKSVAIYNALLHLFVPEKYEPIISNKHKNDIVKAFEKDFFKKEECKEKFEPEIDLKIKCIKENLQKKLKKDNINFYNNVIKKYWYGGLDFEYKNIILHGAPGTGKTYLTLETLKSRKLLGENIEYEFVQFHPSYDYEDFIEGIKPTGIENGHVKLELKNGVFKKICIDAFDSLLEAKGDLKEAKKYYFVVDEINRAELSTVFGELLVCLEDDKRLRVKNENDTLKVEGLKIKLQNSTLWKKEHVVIIVNENDEIVEEGEMYFGVPENLYFIGTMNDIDKSVDSFDMAMRRRFVWKKYSCDYDVIMEHYNDSENVETYVEICEKLNKYITKTLGLGEGFEIGHSYFILPKKLNNTELNKVWEERFAPLLREYLRAEYSESDIEEKLKEMKKLFKLPEKEKNQ